MEKVLYNKKETEVLGLYIGDNDEYMTFEDNFGNQFDVPKKCISAICNVADIAKPSFYYREDITLKNLN